MATATKLKRAVVVGLNVADLGVDSLLHRPAVVRALLWCPVWWNCPLARLSVTLDDRWSTGYWDDGWAPGAPCGACGRRASHVEITGPDGETVPLCGWCHVRGPIQTASDLRRELVRAAAASTSWRWRLPDR